MSPIWTAIQLGTLLFLLVLVESKKPCENMGRPNRSPPPDGCETLRDRSKFFMARDENSVAVSKKLDGTDDGGRRKRQAGGPGKGGQGQGGPGQGGPGQGGQGQGGQGQGGQGQGGQGQGGQGQGGQGQGGQGQGGQGQGGQGQGGQGQGGQGQGGQGKGGQGQGGQGQGGQGQGKGQGGQGQGGQGQGGQGQGGQGQGGPGQGNRRRWNGTVEGPEAAQRRDLEFGRRIQRGRRDRCVPNKDKFTERIRNGAKLGKRVVIGLQRVFTAYENDTIITSREVEPKPDLPEDGQCLTSAQIKDSNDQMVATTRAKMYFSIDGGVSMDVELTADIVDDDLSEDVLVKVTLFADNYRCDPTLVDCDGIASVVFELIFDMGFPPFGELVCNDIECKQIFDEGDVSASWNTEHEVDGVAMTLNASKIRNVEPSVWQIKFDAFTESLMYDPTLKPTSSVLQQEDELDIVLGDEKYDVEVSSCSHIRTSVVVYILPLVLAFIRSYRHLSGERS